MSAKEIILSRIQELDKKYAEYIVLVKFFDGDIDPAIRNKYTFLLKALRGLLEKL